VNLETANDCDKCKSLIEAAKSLKANKATKKNSIYIIKHEIPMHTLTKKEED